MNPSPGRPRRLAFYRRLGAEQKREYDRSDSRTTLPLRPAASLGEAANAVVASLATASPRVVRGAAQRLVDEICASLAAHSRRRPACPPRVKVLRTRPRVARAEFHGLYTRFENGESEIRVWMLTAAHGQVVKARTFLRTLLHEVCHHVDMTLLDLPNSLHTLGFHARESSLLHALEGSGAVIPGGRGATQRTIRPGREPQPKPVQAGPVQLDLFNRPTAGSASDRRRVRSD